MAKQRVYLLGWLSSVGGADTKNVDLIKLIRNDFEITFVPSSDDWFKMPGSQDLIGHLCISSCRYDDLPRKIEGTVLAVCYGEFFSSGRARDLKERGARIVWSNEMMWEFGGEAKAAADGLIDKALFLSQFQEKAFEHIYVDTKRFLIGNYIDMANFRFRGIQHRTWTIGRLSRPAPEKYPLNFPVFYEELALESVRYRVMAWSDDLENQFAWHDFGPEWELLRASEEGTDSFLKSLDLFVYSFSPLFRESWGRAVAEAMLTGCVVLIPGGNNFEQMTIHEQTGFLCEGFDDYQFYAQELWADDALYYRISEAAAEYAREVHANAAAHRDNWRKVLSY